MDRILRRELDAIARDNTSGAAELTLRASIAVQSWLKRELQPRQEALVTVARALQDTQCMMAPMWRLANEIALAADACQSAFSLRRRIGTFSRRVRTGPAKIARHFVRALRGKPDNLLLTYSYSSTVAKALIAARAQILGVYCSEGRPAYEGRAMARLLGDARIGVLFCADAQLLASNFGMWNIVVLGADALLPYTFWNKVGTDVIVANARKRRARVFILADTTKFWPDSMFGLGPHLAGTEHNRQALWRNPPRRVSLMAGVFDAAPIPERAFILTERGPMSPPQMRRAMKKIQISPRLAMVDWFKAQMETLGASRGKPLK